MAATIAATQNAIMEQDGLDVGLGDLFSATHCYSTKQLVFGRSLVDDQEQTTSDLPSPCGVTISLKAATTSSTDYDLTGQIPWPSAYVLGHFLASPAGSALVANKTCVELGAGVGIGSLVASRSCRKIVATDHNETVLELLRDNLEANIKQQTTSCPDREEQEGETQPEQEEKEQQTDQAQQLTASFDVVELDWNWVRQPSLMPTVLNNEGGFECVIGSDIVYDLDQVPSMVSVASYLMKPTGVFVLAHTSRWANTDRRLYSELDKAGFERVSIPLTDFMSEKAIAELGGLPSFLYVLRRKLEA